MTELPDRWLRLRERVAEAALNSGRRPEEVLVVAVTKGVPAESVVAARNLGLREFGENRVQEAREKVPLLEGVRWHGIGRLQTNKASQALRLFSVIQSVDRMELVRVLETAAGRYQKTVEVLIEVNVGGEAQKGGVSPEETPDLVDAVRTAKGLALTGLMTVGPKVGARESFSRLRELRDRLQGNYPELHHLSMGMSQDFEDGIREGATIIRIGQALFGPKRV